MVVIDVNDIIGRLGHRYTEEQLKMLYSANKLDIISTVLTDLGYSVVSGNYVIVEPLLRNVLSSLLAGELNFIPTDTFLMLKQSHHFVGICSLTRF